MNPNVIPFTNESEYFTDELCHIIELSNTSHDEDVSIAQARVEAGVTTRWHRLKQSTERYYILCGAGEVEIGALPAQIVGPGDVVLIPPMCRQRIKNIGNEDLLFLAICSPRFQQHDYENLE